MKLVRVLMMCGLWLSLASAATIHVPADQPTIQAGADMAGEGDTVLLASGVYTGEGNRDVVLSCEKFVIRGAGGAEATVIDCEGSPEDQHRAFWIECDPFSSDTNVTIEGLTISNAYAGAGGGIYCYGSLITVRDCWFISNTVESYGGGAGVVVPSNALFEGCLFVNNHANEGGGIFCSDLAGVTASECTFYGNSSPNGAAAANMYSGYLTLNNCIAAYSTEGMAVYTDPSITTLTCCDLYGNAGGDWVGGIADQLGVDGNISAIPLFCDAADGDFHLNLLSPCAPDNNSCSMLIGAFDVACGCCDLRADINHDGVGPDIEDLVFMVEYMFQQGPEPPCLGNTDIDGNLTFSDIADLVYLVNYMFQPPSPAPVPCP